MVTRAKRISNNKWDAVNMVSITCKLRKDEAERFKEACRRKGVTQNSIFRQAVRDFLEAEQIAGKDTGSG